MVIISDLRVGSLASVIIPTYNRGSLLTEAIKSCLNQTWDDVEIVVVDDGSTDETSSMIGQILSRKWAGHRLRYIKQENRGASAARNEGLKIARGTYVQFLDSDDVLLPAKIEKQIRVLEESQNLDAACCYCGGIMSSSTARDSPEVAIGLRIACSTKGLLTELVSRRVHAIPTPAPLWRREFLLRNAGWREDISLGDDLEYHVRLLANAGKVCFVDEELFFVREHVGPRLSAGQMSPKSLLSLIRTRQAIHSTLEAAGLWDPQTQAAFLGAMRTIYANALQLGNDATIRDLEQWLWQLSGSPHINPPFRSLILLRRTLGRRFLLRAHELLTGILAP